MDAEGSMEEMVMNCVVSFLGLRMKHQDSATSWSQWHAKFKAHTWKICHVVGFILYLECKVVSCMLL